MSAKRERKQRVERTDYDEKEAMHITISEDVEVFSSFDSMGLNEDLLRGIYAYGFERPSAIQQRAIKQIIQGRDVIAQSQSGNEKKKLFIIQF